MISSQFNWEDYSYEVTAKVDFEMLRSPVILDVTWHNSKRPGWSNGRMWKIDLRCADQAVTHVHEVLRVAKDQNQAPNLDRVSQQFLALGWYYEDDRFV